MGGKWKKEKFSELCTITRGGSPRPIHNYIMDKGIPWVKIADATASNSRTINSTKEYIKSTGKQKSREVFPGDLILSNSATPGLPKFMGIYACIHDGWLLLRDFNGLHKEFCYYFLLHERENLVSQGNGSVFTNLKTDILKNHVVDVPTLSEQRAIAHILGTLDDKIELNRQMAQTLESIARAIFKSWFVDFDPVKAKMEGKQPEGMSEEIAALFPDRLVDSELGMIPEGWEVLKFPEEFDFTMGQSPPGSSYNEYFNGVPFYQGSADFGQWYPTERIYCTAPTRFANKGDVLFSVRAPVGDMNIALSDCAIGRGLCCIRHKSGSTALTYLYLTNTKSVMEHNAGEGAVFKSLSKKQLTMLPVVSIPDVIAKSFIKIVDPIFEKIQSLEDNARTLCSLRDTLLPRLISGKIRLKQPEDAAA